MRRIYRYLLLLSIVVLLFGCGGAGPGSPGSGGFEEVGAYIDVVGASHTDPAGDHGDVWQMDLTQTVCDPGPPAVLEAWGDDLAVLTFRATSYDPNNPGGTMYITRYRVEFIPQNFNFGLPPVVEYDLTTSLAIEPDGDDVQGTFMVLRNGDKTEIAEAIENGIFTPSDWPLTYDMKLTFYGVDMYGNDFHFTWHRTIFMDHYNNC